MATTAHQPERNYYFVGLDDLDVFLEDAGELARKHSITVDAVIAAKQALELERRNNIAVQGGNHTDEHNLGLNEVLVRIAAALEARR